MPGGTNDSYSNNGTRAQVHWVQVQHLTHRATDASNDRHTLSHSWLAGTRTSPLWILLELSVMDVVATTGAIRQSNRHH